MHIATFKIELVMLNLEFTFVDEDHRLFIIVNTWCIAIKEDTEDNTNAAGLKQRINICF